MNTQNQENLYCEVSGESPSEEWANFLTHGIGLALSLIGLTFLVSSAIFTQDGWLILSSFIYGITLVLTFFISSLYHNCKNIQTKKRLRIIDHACIYLLIAGSYTPVISEPFNEALSWNLLTGIWGIALAGIFLKIFFTGKFILLSTVMYCLMGWCSIIFVDVLIESLSVEGFMWLLTGGVAYSIGVLFFLWERLPYNHSIWHVFVMLGSACHYYAIANYVVLIT